MNLRVVGPNQTEISLTDGNRLFFSYDTLVAAYFVGRGYVFTTTKYSNTTSKHIKNWIDGEDSEDMIQECFDQLTNLSVVVYKGE